MMSAASVRQLLGLADLVLQSTVLTNEISQGQVREGVETWQHAGRVETGQVGDTGP